MNNQKFIDVSVIVPNYNNGKYLNQFINSVLHSIYLPKELIIIDDGSTDDSIKVINLFNNHKFIKLISYTENRGLTFALNLGLESATGKYIMRADPDDLLLPERIGNQYHYMEKNPEIDILGCNVTYFKDNPYQEFNSSNFPITHIEIVKKYKKGEHGIQHPTAFIKSNVFKKYRYQKIFPGEDYEIFSRMVKDKRIFANLSDSLYLMRIHSESSTSNLKLSAIKQTFKFRDQIFGTKSYILKILFYYLFITFYRKSQLNNQKLKKLLLLSIACIFYPSKAFNRIIKKIY